jgi:hypothetical protein
MYIVETNEEKRILTEDCVTNVEFKNNKCGRHKGDIGRQEKIQCETSGDIGRHRKRQ